MDRPEELERLAEDWITLWQSEIAGLAADPEAIEAWSAFAALTAAWARAMASIPRGARDDGAAAPSRPAPAAAASQPAGAAGDGGDGQPRPPPDAERDRMAARLAELERRLADLEGGSAGSKPDRRGTRRRRGSA